MLNGKIFPKARRRHSLWYWMAFSFALCIGILLGVNIALLIFASTSIVSLNLLGGLPAGQMLAYLISLSIAALLGLAFVVGYIWTFAGASSTYEAAAAYEHEYGCFWPWPRALVVGLELFFLALDLISLLYRREYFAGKGAEQLFWFFVVLSLLSPVIGLLMHILENKPLSHRLVEAQRHTANLVGDDLEQLINSMPFDKRTRVLSGDGAALREHYDAIRTHEEEIRQAEEQRRQEKYERAQERGKRRQESQRPLASASLLSQAEQGSPEKK